MPDKGIESIRLWKCSLSKLNIKVSFKNLLIFEIAYLFNVTWCLDLFLLLKRPFLVARMGFYIFYLFIPQGENKGTIFYTYVYVRVSVFIKY